MQQQKKCFDLLSFLSSDSGYQIHHIGRHSMKNDIAYVEKRLPRYDYVRIVPDKIINGHFKITQTMQRCIKQNDTSKF